MATLYTSDNTTPNDRRQNTTDYDHPQETNLLNLHKAMEYNAAGQPVLRVNNVGGVAYNEAGNISGSIDAFGRLRVSEPYTLFDSSLRYADNASKWDQVDTASGTSTHLPNEASVLMSVTGDGDEVIRQTRQVFSYQPGKSMLILNTVVMNTPTAGLRQRVGYFGTQNGVYLETDGTTVNLVIRKYTSGAVDNTTEKVSQNNWNSDRLNGQGGQHNLTGATLDISKAQIFWVDIEWLGVGSVRCGFVINGQFIVCHIFHHANILDKVYMTTATLPIRYEITSTGASGSMRAICSSVISEGGYVNRSRSRTASTAIGGKSVSSTGYTPLIAIRLKSTRLDAVVIPSKYDVYGLTNAPYKYVIFSNPTLTGASWVDAGSDSSVEYDLSATSLSGGTIIDAGLFASSAKGGGASNFSDVDFTNQLGRSIAGESDIFVLAAIATTNNDKAAATLVWQEHT